jgi:hypothetical protein
VLVQLEPLFGDDLDVCEQRERPVSRPRRESQSPINPAYGMGQMFRAGNEQD